MTSSIFVKTLNRSLLSAAAAVVLLSGAASAAEAGDAQRQARDVLVPTIASPVVSTGAMLSIATRDAQEQARRVILAFDAGVTLHRASDLATKTSSSTRTMQLTRRAEADAQQRARRMLTGAAG